MHDTANRWLFTEGSRNFSHGCIRLQNPLDFAEKVFKGRSGFDKAREVPLTGRPSTFACSRNPNTRNFWLGMVED